MLNDYIKNRYQINWFNQYGKFMQTYCNFWNDNWNEWKAPHIVIDTKYGFVVHPSPLSNYDHFRMVILANQMKELDPSIDFELIGLGSLFV